MTIKDFSKINKGQEMIINRLLTLEAEKKALLKPIIEKHNDKALDYHVITEDIIIVEEKNPFLKYGGEYSQYESYFTAYVKGARVLKTGTFTLNNAILLGLAALNGNEDAYPFLCRIIDVVE